MSWAASILDVHAGEALTIGRWPDSAVRWNGRGFQALSALLLVGVTVACIAGTSAVLNRGTSRMRMN